MELPHGSGCGGALMDAAGHGAGCDAAEDGEEEGEEEQAADEMVDTPTQDEEPVAFARPKRRRG